MHPFWHMLTSHSPFRLNTDASFDDLGAVLAQVQDGRERVMGAYASRSLHPTEPNNQNYSSFKLELLALKWEVTEQFKDYLYCAELLSSQIITHWYTCRRLGLGRSNDGQPSCQLQVYD